MKDINEYIKLPKEDRQNHLRLDEPCLERGGQSMYCKGLLAHIHDTTIPSGHKIHVCHACHNGACSNPNFHGHNYELIVSVTGEIDQETGYVLDVKVLTDLIKEEVENPFDHKNLNLDVPEFKDLNPTAENIAVVIWNKLRNRLNIKFNLEVVLYETPRNFVTYRGQ